MNNPIDLAALTVVAFAAVPLAADVLPAAALRVMRRWRLSAGLRRSARRTPITISRFHKRS